MAAKREATIKINFESGGNAPGDLEKLVASERRVQATVERGNMLLEKRSRLLKEQTTSVADRRPAVEQAFQRQQISGIEQLSKVHGNYTSEWHEAENRAHKLLEKGNTIIAQRSKMLHDQSGVIAKLAQAADAMAMPAGNQLRLSHGMGWAAQQQKLDQWSKGDFLGAPLTRMLAATAAQRAPGTLRHPDADKFAKEQNRLADLGPVGRFKESLGKVGQRLNSFVDSIPVVGTAKKKLGELNDGYTNWLTNRHGSAWAKTIKYGGAAADMGMMGATGFTFPGASLAMSAPLLGIAEAQKGVTKLVSTVATGVKGLFASPQKFTVGDHVKRQENETNWRKLVQAPLAASTWGQANDGLKRWGTGSPNDARETERQRKEDAARQIQFNALVDQETKRIEDSKLKTKARREARKALGLYVPEEVDEKAEAESKKAEKQASEHEAKWSRRLAIASTAVAAVVTAGQAARDIGNAIGHQGITGAERLERIMTSIPGWKQGWEIGAGLGESITGDAERRRRGGEEHELRMATIPMRFRDAAMRSDILRQRDTTQNSAESWRGVRLYRPEHTERITLSQQRLYSEEQRLMPFRDAQAQAHARRNAARQTHAQDVSRLADAEAVARSTAETAAELDREANRVRQGRSAGSSDVSTRSAFLAAERARETAIHAENEALRLRNQAIQSGIDLEQRQYEFQRARTDRLREEVNMLQEKERRIAAAAQRLGGMNMADRQLGVEAVRFIQQHGIGMATPEMRQYAGAVAGDWLANQQEQFGENSPEMAELRRMGVIGHGDTETLREIRQQANAANVNLRQNIIIDEQRLAERLGTLLNEMIPGFIRSVEQRTQHEINRIAQGQMMKNALGVP